MACRQSRVWRRSAPPSLVAVARQAELAVARECEAAAAGRELTRRARKGAVARARQTSRRRGRGRGGGQPDGVKIAPGARQHFIAEEDVGNDLERKKAILYKGRGSLVPVRVWNRD